MEDLIQEQIEEKYNYEIAELEREMENDPRYHLYTAIERLKEARDLTWKAGNLSAKDYIQTALSRARIALTMLEEDNEVK